MRLPIVVVGLQANAWTDRQSKGRAKTRRAQLYNHPEFYRCLQALIIAGRPAGSLSACGAEHNLYD